MPKPHTAEELKAAYRQACEMAGRDELSAVSYREIAQEHGLPNKCAFYRLWGKWNPARWTNGKLYRVFVVPDLHCPYHDEKAVSVALQALKQYRPDEVVILGDLVDFYPISKYLKDPARKFNLQQELDVAAKVLGQIRSAAGGAKIVLLEGNHELRLFKDLCRRAAEYHQLRALEITRLLELEKYNVKWIPESKFYQIGPVTFTHGEFATTYTAAKNIREYGASIVCGHTHHMQCRHQRMLTGELVAWEAGCLCSFAVANEYKKFANWQQGFMVAGVQGKRVWFQAYHIQGGQVLFQGNIIHPTPPAQVP